jgi:hypothetical protein
VALSPLIPTSFVPKQPVSPSRRPTSSGNNLFLLISLIIFGIVVFASAGVYLYATYLTGVEKTKAAQVAAAEAAVSPATVGQFIRLRDRLAAADTVLNQHVELSQFFTLLESITLQDVHFSNLKILVADDRSATITMTGDAHDFNSLAAESTAFAAQPDIKSAIFSGITANSSGTVAFTLTAALDPNLVIETTAPTTAVLLPVGSASSTVPTTQSLQTTSSTSTPTP